MKKINILSEEIASKIAAGEVIDRPVAVVKELIENAIDADSTVIKIEVIEGGLKEITITDNGTGIDNEEVELAFFRHATSKLRCVEDLNRLKTMGFRGEALASIAAVSQLEIITRTKEQIEGSKLSLEGGKIKQKSIISANVGTKISIKNLFYNLPARLKFIKSNTKELNLIINTVYRLALAHPQISFKLLNNGKQIFNSLGTNKLIDIIGNIYGLPFTQDLLELNYQDENFTIQGFISNSQLYRANRNQQILIVNNRMVYYNALVKSIEAGYSGIIPLKKYPNFIIKIWTNPAEIDVNMHPSKLEIKLEKEEKLTSILYGEVKARLALINQFSQHSFHGYPSKNIDYMDAEPQIMAEATLDFLDNTILQEEVLPLNQEITKRESLKNSISGKNLMEDHYEEQNYLKNLEPKQALNEAIYESNTFEHKTEKDTFPYLQVQTQLFNSYIVAIGPMDNIYIIDQHAAEERINYNEIKLKQRAHKISAQVLAIPLNIELTTEETNVLLQNIVIINDLGILIEHFGQNTFLIRSFPLGISYQFAKDLLIELLNKLSTYINPKETLFDEMLKMIACKKSIKANRKLSTEEMEYLIKRLQETEYPFTCPHGRPTFIMVTKKELEKRFLRT
jgi:DNA mismatch repair protein MutL